MKNLFLMAIVILGCSYGVQGAAPSSASSDTSFQRSDTDEEVFGCDSSSLGSALPAAIATDQQAEEEPPVFGWWDPSSVSSSALPAADDDSTDNPSSSSSAQSADNIFGQLCSDLENAYEECFAGMLMIESDSLKKELQDFFTGWRKRLREAHRLFKEDETLTPEQIRDAHALFYVVVEKAQVRDGMPAPNDVVEAIDRTLRELELAEAGGREKRGREAEAPHSKRAK